MEQELVQRLICAQSEQNDMMPLGNIPWSPELVRMPVFGDELLPIDQEWPTQDDLSSLDLLKKIKLESISIGW